MNINKRLVFSIAITAAIGRVFSYLAINFFSDYSFGLFIWLPLVMGFVSTILYGLKNDNCTYLAAAPIYSLLTFGGGLLIFAWEGVICLLMAIIPAAFVAWIGYLMGKFVINQKVNTTSILILAIISVPSLMAFEHIEDPKTDIRSVVTSIEINAASEAVWKNVISFPKLKEPKEFIFKTGIAYPIDATIEGHGVGAIRHCNFSTGSFVEPITVWNEPNLLQFSVTEQPATMKEIIIYDIQPNHLHGYWVSHKGQFKLLKLPNGNTLLEGTTWYSCKIRPGWYWNLWSDYIVHKIHTRVLEHIKQQSEMK